MDVLVVSGLAVAGALAGIPIAAISYSAPVHGRLRAPEGWWRGMPAPPASVAAISLVAAVTAALVGGLIPVSPALPAYWLFAVLGVGLAIIDLRRRRLPHPLTGTLIVACLVCFVAAAAISDNPGPLLRATVAGAATTAILLIIALSLPGQLGLGDIALAGAITLNLGWLSWQAAALGILCGLVLQGVVGLAAKARAGGNIAVPMGPALLAGWLVGVVLQSG